MQMNRPYRFGEDKTSNNIDTGPAPKTLTKFDANTDAGGHLTVTSYRWDEKK